MTEAGGDFHLDWDPVSVFRDVNNPKFEDSKEEIVELLELLFEQRYRKAERSGYQVPSKFSRTNSRTRKSRSGIPNSLRHAPPQVDLRGIWNEVTQVVGQVREKLQGEERIPKDDEDLNSRSFLNTLDMRALARAVGQLSWTSQEQIDVNDEKGPLIFNLTMFRSKTSRSHVEMVMPLFKWTPTNVAGLRTYAYAWFGSEGKDLNLLIIIPRGLGSPPSTKPSSSQNSAQPDLNMMIDIIDSINKGTFQMGEDETSPFDIIVATHYVDERWCWRKRCDLMRIAHMVVNPSAPICNQVHRMTRFFMSDRGRRLGQNSPSACVYLKKLLGENLKNDPSNGFTCDSPEVSEDSDDSTFPPTSVKRKLRQRREMSPLHTISEFEMQLPDFRTTKGKENLKNDAF